MCVTCNWTYEVDHPKRVNNKRRTTMKKRINFTLTTQSFFFCKCFSHRMTSWPEYSHSKKSPALKKRITTMKKTINFTLTPQSLFCSKFSTQHMTTTPQNNHTTKSPAPNKRISHCDGIHQKLLYDFYLLLYQTLILFYH